MPTEETVSRSHTTRKAGHTDSLVPAMPTPHTLTPDTCHDHDPDASRLLISREATPVAHMLPRIQPLLRRPSRLGTHTHTHTHTHTSALTAQREESALSLPVHAHSARWPADRPTLRRTHAIACRCTRRSAAQSALYRAQCLLRRAAPEEIRSERPLPREAEASVVAAWRPESGRRRRDRSRGAMEARAATFAPVAAMASRASRASRAASSASKALQKRAHTHSEHPGRG